MSTLALPDVGTIEHLDFESEVPCEHSQHWYAHRGDEPARYLVETQCPKCDESHRYTLCHPGWEWMGRGPGSCASCGRPGERSDFLRIVEVLR